MDRTTIIAESGRSIDRSISTGFDCIPKEIEMIKDPSITTYLPPWTFAKMFENLKTGDLITRSLYDVSNARDSFISDLRCELKKKNDKTDFRPFPVDPPSPEASG
jgi:hypothetical protein